jgi:hypothetical protein
LLGSVVFALDPDPCIGAVGRSIPAVRRGVLSEITWCMAHSTETVHESSIVYLNVNKWLEGPE